MRELTPILCFVKNRCLAEIEVRSRRIRARGKPEEAGKNGGFTPALDTLVSFELEEEPQNAAPVGRIGLHEQVRGHEPPG